MAPSDPGPTTPNAAAPAVSESASEPEIRIVAEPVADPARRTLFVAGNAATWTRIDLEISSPTLLQAGGLVASSGVVSGPEGLTSVPVLQVPLDSGEPVVPSAPFLSLIGRVCSQVECSLPFVIGSRLVVCPSVVGVSGSLELWTNNRARMGQAQTRSGYSTATGGYHVYAEPASDSPCGTIATPPVAPDDASRLSTGLRIEREEFIILSSQSNWKPFFVPLDRPIRINAFGEMKPEMHAQATGPEGIAVPAGGRWVYPGAPQVVVDADHRLFVPDLPYQALIGRVCGDAGCGRIFLVGAARDVCAPEGYRDRLELWTNHIIQPTTLLGRTLPMSMQTFQLQARTGEYQFGISAVPSGACGQ